MGVAHTAHRPTPPDAVSPLRVLWLAILVTIGSLLQKFVPITIWVGWLGSTMKVPEELSTITYRDDPRGNPGKLAKAITLACNALPWTPSCLAQAFAGQQVLRQKGKSGIVIIGLRPRWKKYKRNWPVHAWLISEGQIVTGGAVSHRYFPASAHVIGETRAALTDVGNPAS